MSFSEAFHPDNQDVLKTEEKARYVAGESIDGAAVGWDKPQDKTDKSSENNEDSEWDKKKPEKKIASIDETQISINEWKLALTKYAKEDPSSLALQDHWPEAVKQAGLEVENKGWPC